MKNRLSNESLQVPVFVRSGRFMRTGEAWGLFIRKGGVRTQIEAAKQERAGKVSTKEIIKSQNPKG